MENELKITVEESGNNIGFLIKKKGTKGNAIWQDLSRDEQLRVLNLFWQGHEFFSRYVNNETPD